VLKRANPTDGVKYMVYKEDKFWSCTIHKLCFYH